MGIHTQKSKAEAPASIHGYFLITEIEQVYNIDLQKTLCVSYPGTDPKDPTGKTLEVDSEGFYDPTLASCRSAKWDPTKRDGSGIPKGDWCAATNSPATATCHDAYQSKSFHAFQAFKVAKDHCKPF